MFYDRPNKTPKIIIESSSTTLPPLQNFDEMLARYAYVVAIDTSSIHVGKDQACCHLSDKKDRLPRKVPRCQVPSAVASATRTWRSFFTKTISAGEIFDLISFLSCARFWWQKSMLLPERLPISTRHFMVTHLASAFFLNSAK
jgi:hypothetical protein